MSSDIRMFGEAAFEKGFISTAQLYEALAEQARLEAGNRKRKFLGEILVEIGHMTEKQVLEVLNELHSTQRDRVR